MTIPLSPAAPRLKGFSFPLSALSLAIITTLAMTPAQAEEKPGSGDTDFDLQAMKARGIDPKLADWFRDVPRFSPGHAVVALSVNGNARGKIRALFNDKGELCPTSDLLEQAGLKTSSSQKESDNCFDLKKAWPQADITLDPPNAAVMIVVPQDAIANSDTITGDWNHGGVAGMLNYDAQYLDSSSSQSSGVTFSQVGTEAGFNAGDWIFRSRQTFSRFNDENQIQHQAAFAQRTFSEQKKVFQAGEVSLSNSMFGTGQVLGFQIFPEQALQTNNNGGGSLVEGIASTQSVVEVRQSGALIYSTTVPAGPYSLKGIPLLNTRSDLNVTLTGTDGLKQQFTVPASAYLVNGASVVPGFSFGAGKLEQQGSAEAPILATAANGWQLGSRASIGAGLLGSNPYRATAMGLNYAPFDSTYLTMQATAAQDNNHGDNGISLTSTLTHNLTERTGVNLNATQQTSGYRELSDALQSDETDATDRTRNQVGVGLSYSQPTLGSFSTSWSQGTTFRGEQTRYLRGAWSRNFGRAYLGASVEQNTGGAYGNDNRVYVTLNIPFGGRSVSSWLNTSNGSSRYGTRYSDRTSQDRGWSVSTEKDSHSGDVNTTGTVDMVTPVSQLSGSYSQDTESSRSWSARATGGIVAHSHGLTLTPYRVGDTFGIAKVGDESGIRLETPAGPTWTGHNGYAVLPTLNSYRRSSVEIDTRSLPKNVDVGNALQQVDAARGSVSYVNFDVIHSRRVLVTATDIHGKPLQSGSSLFDAKGNFVTVVGSNGSVFIPDASPNMQLDVQSSGKTYCSLSIALPEKANNNVLYESASAVCQPSASGNA